MFPIIKSSEQQLMKKIIIILNLSRYNSKGCNPNLSAVTIGSASTNEEVYLTCKRRENLSSNDWDTRDEEFGSVNRMRLIKELS